jgi:predicted GH43/DUF377 family glycosyl hydrolase
MSVGGQHGRGRREGHRVLIFLFGCLLAAGWIVETRARPSLFSVIIASADSNVVVITPSSDSSRGEGLRARFSDSLADPIARAWERSRAEPAERRPRSQAGTAGGKELPWKRLNTAPSRTVFEKFPGNPVLPLGNAGSLDAGHAEYPSVVVAGDLLWMFYSAYGVHRRWEIAAAVSLDGIRWTKLGVTLAPDTTASAWDSTTIAFPCVLYSEEAPAGEGFRMWYAGKRGGRYEGIGLATSSDGRHWHREGQVLSTGNPDEWDGAQILDPAVIEVDGEYRMYYCGTRADRGLASIGVARSADGRHWVKLARNPVYRLAKEDGGIYTVDVVADGGAFLLFASSPKGKREYEVHAVRSSDGLSFDAAKRRLVLAPARDSSWDHALVYGMDVMARGDSLYMWFNGLYTSNVTRGGQVGLARTTKATINKLLGRP